MFSGWCLTWLCLYIMLLTGPFEYRLQKVLISNGPFQIPTHFIANFQFLLGFRQNADFSRGSEPLLPRASLRHQHEQNLEGALGPLHHQFWSQLPKMSDPKKGLLEFVRTGFSGSRNIQKLPRSVPAGTFGVHDTRLPYGFAGARPGWHLHCGRDCGTKQGCAFHVVDGQETGDSSCKVPFSTNCWVSV